MVLDYLVTASNVANIIGLRSMLARFEGGAGHSCLDSAYPTGDVCSAISEMGMVPRIKPKSNTTHNAFGSQAWREMVDLSVQDPDTFKSEYHQRSIIEAVFGAIEKMYGNHTRCHKPENQCREIAIRIICYHTIIEAVFGAIEKMYGNHTRCHKRPCVKQRQRVQKAEKPGRPIAAERLCPGVLYQSVACLDGPPFGIFFHVIPDVLTEPRDLAVARAGHRTRGQIEGKGLQAHTEADRYHDCMTGAADTTLAQRSSTSKFY